VGVDINDRDRNSLELIRGDVMHEAWPRFRYPENLAEPVELLIYDVIGFSGVTAEEFAAELSAVPAGRGVVVRINSFGGQAFDAMAIFNRLLDRKKRGTVATVIDGVGASAASVIFQAGDTRTMNAGTEIMIHEAQSLRAGTAADHRKEADLLESVNANIAEIYSERVTIEPSDVAELMTEETWMSAARAIEMGFADDSGASSAIAACAGFELSGLKRRPSMANANDSHMLTREVARRAHDTRVRELELKRRGLTQLGGSV